MLQCQCRPAVDGDEHAGLFISARRIWDHPASADCARANPCEGKTHCSGSPRGANSQYKAILIAILLPLSHPHTSLICPLSSLSTKSNSNPATMKTLALTTLVATALAVPNATITPAEGAGSCYSYPLWQNTRDHDISGAWQFVVDGADDPAINGLPLQPYTLSWGSGTRNILGADWIKSTWFAKQYYQCFNGVPRTYTGPVRNLTISRDMRNAHLLQNAPKDQTYVPELYHHEVDGKRMDGVYLGALNKTTWGFYPYGATCGADGSATNPFLEVKLMGLPVDPNVPPTAGYDPMYYGFIKLVAY